MKTDKAPEPGTEWADDVLERESIGRMLETHLARQCSLKSGASLTVALDAKWGAGKTFFVERWAHQLRNNKRGVIFFDAWQHDHATEPVLAFMAELRDQIKEMSARVINEAETMNVIEENISTALGSFRKVAAPIAKVVVGGALKKMIGSSIEDFASAISDSNEADMDERVSQGPGLLDKAVDLYLNRVLQDHQEKRDSIQKFRSDLESLVSSLVAAKAMEGPMFILIDELDRCRPDFALRLLEGIKHIFNATNVCFVFATNLHQLSASIQAIYGPKFDGRDYLGRFFDLEVQLPQPTQDQFSKLLFLKDEQDVLGRLACGNYYFHEISRQSHLVNLWTGLSRSLAATLRQQQQAYLTLILCCESWPRGWTISGFWLVFLSILHKAHPETFHSLKNLKRGDTKSIEAIMQESLGTSWGEARLVRLGYAEEESQARSVRGIAYRYIAVSKLNEYEAAQIGRATADPLETEIASFLSGRALASNPSVLTWAFDLVSSAGVFSEPMRG